MPKTSRKQALGIKGEQAFRQMLRRHRIPHQQMPYECAYDFLVRETRVEIKTAKLRTVKNSAGWLFNVHRHGIVKNECDVYILRLEGVPRLQSHAINLLLPAPVTKTVIYIGLRDFLQGKHANMAVAFNKWFQEMQR